MEKVGETKIKNSSVTERILGFIENAEDFAANLVNDIKDVFHWVTKFTSNFIGTIFNLFFDVIRTVFGDAPQFIINFLQTIPDGTWRDLKLMYSEDNMEADIDGNYSTFGKYYASGQRDAYIKFSSQYLDTKWGTYADQTWTYNIYVDDLEKDNYMFEDIAFPLTCVDFYGMAANKISILDANFFNTSEHNPETETVWFYFRNFASGIIRASLYIAAGILITSLIWHGVKVVKGSTDNPAKRKENKEGLNKFVNGVVMLVGTILVMSICLYAYEAAWSGVETGDDDSAFPIRVHVAIAENTWFDDGTIKADTCSFSTTITGFVRFMAEIENPDRFTEKAFYVITYVILVWVNMALLILMIIRVIGLWILSMVGPIISAMYAVTESPKMMNAYKSWVSLYAILALMQFVLAIIYRVVLEVMCST